MKQLPEWIRKGLATEGVVEDSYSWTLTACDGIIGADIIGLILIGKIGLEKAREFMVEGADIRIDDVAKELGITREKCLDLEAAHYEVCAADIARLIENKTFAYNRR